MHKAEVMVTMMMFIDAIHTTSNIKYPKGPIPPYRHRPQELTQKNPRVLQRANNCSVVEAGAQPTSDPGPCLYRESRRDCCLDSLTPAGRWLRQIGSH